MKTAFALIFCLFAVPALAEPRFFRDCPDCPEMAVLPAGSFTMGAPESEADSDKDERPQRQVTIAKPFAMARTEITRSLFARFVEETGYFAQGCWLWSKPGIDMHRSWYDPGFPQGADHPAVCVNWMDAMAFVAWLSARAEKTYRLPTEEEWEYAARAGSAAARFWGEEAGRACKFANVGDKSVQPLFPKQPFHDCDDGFVYTAPAGSFAPNAFGLHDMLGNALEWTVGCYDKDAYAKPEIDPRAKRDCAHVLRGGSWYSRPRNVRSANRTSINPLLRNASYGIRVVRDLD